MRDTISIERAKKLHPLIADEVIKIIDEAETKLPANVAVRIVQGLRTFEEQDELYQKGRTTAGPKVTNAKPGSSYHQYGLALDFALLIDKNGDGIYDELSWSLTDDMDKDGQKDWFEVIVTFKKYGYESGAEWRTFKDYPHLQKPFGYSWKQLYTKYANENFLAGTKYIDTRSAV